MVEAIPQTTPTTPLKFPSQEPSPTEGSSSTQNSLVQRLERLLRHLRAESSQHLRVQTQQDQVSRNRTQGVSLEELVRSFSILSMRRGGQNSQPGHGGSPQTQGGNGGMRPQQPQNPPFQQNQFANLPGQLPAANNPGLPVDIAQQPQPNVIPPMPPADDLGEPHPDENGGLPELDPNFQVPDPVPPVGEVPNMDGMGGGAQGPDGEQGTFGGDEPPPPPPG